jgi:hypothetical protein
MLALGQVGIGIKPVVSASPLTRTMRVDRRVDMSPILEWVAPALTTSIFTDPFSMSTILVDVNIFKNTRHAEIRG